MEKKLNERKQNHVKANIDMTSAKHHSLESLDSAEGNL